MMCLRIFLLIILTPFLADNAKAHQFAPSLLKVIQVQPNEYSVVWKTPARGLGRIPLRPVMPEDCEVVGESPVIREGAGMVSRWKLRCRETEKGLVGQTLGVTGLAANQASVMAMVTLLDGRHLQQVLNMEVPEFIVPAAPRPDKVISEYSILGIKHILGGLDHLLFVFGLLLLVGGSTRLLWTITAFTVGHSITLALVSLGLFSYPVALMELAIALSIFFLALELAQGDQGRGRSAWWPRFRDHPWRLAGCFGLLHGMGFAGALSAIGLPQGNVLPALLSFNIGIEAGQIAFVIAVIAAWRIFRHLLSIDFDRLLPVPAYLLGGMSAMWCIERGMEVLF